MSEDSTFFQKYNELMNNLSHSARSKKKLISLAQQFSELSENQDINNPFELYFIGLGLQGEMMCYKRLEENASVVQVGLKAARIFIKTAKFNYKLSKSIIDSYSDPFSNAIQCYKSVINILKNERKYNLVVNLLKEMGNAEQYFSKYHYAANVFEEATIICCEENIMPRLLIECAELATECYTKNNMFDLAMLVLKRAVDSLEVYIINNDIEKSEFWKKRIYEFILLSIVFLIMNLKFDKPIKLGNKYFNEETNSILKSFIKAVCCQSTNELRTIFKEIKKLNYLSELTTNSIERYICKTKVIVV